MITPSLAMIPQAYKSGKVYSQLPVSGDGDFDFTRASSATRVNKDGFIEEVAVNVPRLDYSDGGCPSLLLEGTATNVTTYSNDFTNSSWSGVFIENNGISPDGTLNADKFVFAQGGSYPQFYKSVSGLVVGQEYTSTMYIKKTENSSDFEINSSGTLFNPTNEWQRVVKTFTASSTTQTVLLNYVVSVGVGVINEIYVAFAQLEQGSYATSYIPTQGGAVTRVLDASSQTVPSGVKIENQGSLYFEFNSSYLEAYSQRILTISEDVSNLIEFQLASANLLTFVLVKSGQSGVVITQSAPSITLGENTKIAAAFSNGDFVFYVNGTLIGTDTDPSKSVPTISDIKFSRYNSTTPFIGSVNNLKLYNTRLSNAELQALTSN